MERIYGGGPSGKTAGMPGPSRRRFLLPAAALIAVLTAVTVLSPIFQSGGADEVTVHFILDLPDARSVSLAGDFTDWNPDLYRLSRKTEEGRWEVRVRLRKNRLYTYNFVIDGEEWIPDPGSYYRVEDGFGGESSLLQL
jgi:1,4-alpha-glucan branching enzyme